VTDHVDPRAARRCIKCGREVGPDESICAVCNRAGMVTPSATQYHGTMVAAIIAGVAVLAIAASLAMRGIGPFTAEVLTSAPRAGDTLAVELAIANEGQHAGRARCQLVAYDGSGRTVRTRSFVTVEIGGGQRTQISETMPGITAAPRRVTVSCEG
jgi:hypothetical protein